MRTDLAHAAARLVTEDAGDGQGSTQVAERAVQAVERLAGHLSRLLGETGVRLMIKRSVVLAAAEFPWLIEVSSSERGTASLCDVMAQQDSQSITGAFVAILSALVGLLERLIGEPLVARLLDEVWPSVFTHAAKDTP